MILNKETVYTKDVDNNKLRVVREFDAPVKKVWNAWTKSELLDQWWAPRPWKANTTLMDFREGGRWLYFMEGPDGTKHHCCVEYYTISPQKSFSGLDAFCDEQGNINNEFPRMKWYVGFVESDDTTKVEVEISFDSAEDMDKIVEMGFKEGFAMAHNNLDELLAEG